MSEQTTVLVAEDDPAARQILARLLTRHGYTVLTAEDGAEALDLIGPEVEVVLVDWMMPKVNGLELCRRLKSEEVPGFRYLIMVTARSQKRDVVEALTAGADDYVSKPVDHDELLARIKAGVRIVREHRALEDRGDRWYAQTRCDLLTGLHDRRCFDRRLSSELRRSRRKNTELALLLVDPDHLRSINEGYGQTIGDMALREVAKLIQEQVREGSDSVARYGGAQIAVIAPDTRRHGAWRLAERVRERVAALRVRVWNGDLLVTVSIGVAIFDPGTGETEDAARQLIEAASERLGEAKHGGRNRVAA